MVATTPADRADDGAPQLERAELPRHCDAVGCAAHLSRYNHTPTCWLHGPGSDPMLQPR